ncbi:MAG: radical SAM protein [Deltaproteobacteria bacterium]|nr:radical SAM protein [Deltaproteobacteria bacterium]
MKSRPFYLRLINALSEKYYLIDFFFSYSGKIIIGFKNKVLLEIDFKPEDKDRFFKVLDGVGYRYRYIGKVVKKSEGIDKFVSGLISLIHHYRNELIKTGQVIYIRKNYIFEPDLISDIIPFLSYEEKGRDSELLVRFTRRCNQACEFCSSPVIKEDPDIVILKKIILNLTNKRTFQISVTGGEPAVRKEFAEFIKWLLIKTKAPVVRIQTNAVAFSDKKLLNILPFSARVQFFVSLHSLEEKTYNIITSSNGQLKKAKAGIKNLIKKGYDVVVNVVINRYNYRRMDSYLKELFNLFGTGIKVHFSVLILPEYRKNLEKYIVSYREIVKNIIPLMEKYNIPVESLISSTHASIPLCYLPEKEKFINKYKGHRDLNNIRRDKYWVKTDRCKTCLIYSNCIGIP